MIATASFKNLCLSLWSCYLTGRYNELVIETEHIGLNFNLELCL